MLTQLFNNYRSTFNYCTSPLYCHRAVGPPTHSNYHPQLKKRTTKPFPLFCLCQASNVEWPINTPLLSVCVWNPRTDEPLPPTLQRSKPWIPLSLQATCHLISPQVNPMLMTVPPRSSVRSWTTNTSRLSLQLTALSHNGPVGRCVSLITVPRGSVND